MNLHDYVTVLRRRWISAVVMTLGVVLAATVLSLTLTPQYTATTRLFFGVQAGESVSDLNQGSAFTEKQMASYEEVATSPLVLDKVITTLGLDTTTESLAQQVQANSALGTVVLEISVTGTDPQTAATIANTIAQELSNTVGTLTPEQSDGREAVRATILAPARVPSAPSSPNIPRNVALGLAVGVLAGIGTALLRNLLDTNIRNEADVRNITDAPVLGTIAFDEHVLDHPVIIADDPHSTAAEAIRRLRTNLQFVGNEDAAKTLVITSSVPGEGKSTTGINVAVSMADAGARVILIDADLRRPSVATYTGIEGRAGLTSILIGRVGLDDVVQTWRDTALHVLPAGPVPPNPSELLGSRAMSELLVQLAERYDVILLDTPPLLPVTDATILTKMVGGAVVIVGADRLHRGQLHESLSILQTAGAHVHGLVVNKIARRDSHTYGYSYGYGYTSDTRPEADPGAEAPVPANAGAGRTSAGPAATRQPDVPVLSGPTKRD